MLHREARGAAELRSVARIDSPDAISNGCRAKPAGVLRGDGSDREAGTAASGLVSHAAGHRTPVCSAAGVGGGQPPEAPTGLVTVGRLRLRVDADTPVHDGDRGRQRPRDGRRGGAVVRRRGDRPRVRSARSPRARELRRGRCHPGHQPTDFAALARAHPRDARLSRALVPVARARAAIGAFRWCCLAIGTLALLQTAWVVHFKTLAITYPQYGAFYQGTTTAIRGVDRTKLGPVRPADRQPRLLRGHLTACS